MTNEQQDGRIAIEGELTIYTVMELKDKFLAGLLTNDVLELDLSQVNEIDAAGLQLLVVAKKGALALSKALRITGQSPVVVELLNISGMTNFLSE